MKLEIIQEQYKEYPYPIRDPESERHRLISMVGSSLAELNHWLFQGKESFENDFRVLVAGGGTGDASTFLALELQHTNAEIVYLDFSHTSLEIARKRAEVRGLKNIRWICGDLLDLDQLNLGEFDYIDCVGVLHHLASPLEGLKQLKGVLKESGGMNLMLYGKYGRSGVYLIQELLRNILGKSNSRKEEIQSARAILKQLPKDHPFFRSSLSLLTDLETDEGFYDVCLHKQDRAYTIQEVETLAEEAGLHFIDFFEPSQRLSFLPENVIQDEGILQKVKALSPSKQRSVLELWAANSFRHAFCVSKNPEASATVEDLDLAPYFYAPDDVSQELKKIFRRLKPDTNYSSLTLNLGPYRIKIPLTPYTLAILQEIENETPLCDLFRSQTVPKRIFIEEAKKALTPLITAGLVLLRDKKLKSFKKWM